MAGSGLNCISRATFLSQNVHHRSILLSFQRHTHFFSIFFFDTEKNLINTEVEQMSD